LDRRAGARLSVRILFASHYALPHLGGIEVVVDALARELAGRGHEIVHLASAAGGAEPQPYEVIRVPAFNAPERHGVPWPVFGPQLYPRVRDAVARADVVHGHGMLYLSSALALRLGGRRTVLTEHVGHVDYESPPFDRTQALAIRTLGRATARRARAIVVLNDKVGEEMRALAPGARVLRIPNGVDTRAYRPPEPGERERLRAHLGWDERPRALFVGRLVAKKGIDLALAAAAFGRFELVIAGPGRAPAGANALGPLPRERVAELYRAADALVLPSRGEGFPVVAQEAMASALPVVLLDDPAYGPYLDGAGPGARTVAADPPAIAAALTALFGDAAAGAAAREHARRAFSWARAADEHEALYASL
jgi:glycosyltransferase involved in cell wall biosynthesis